MWPKRMKLQAAKMLMDAQLYLAQQVGPGSLPAHVSAINHALVILSNGSLENLKNVAFSTFEQDECLWESL